MAEFTGKTVVVTGAAGSLGRSVAERFAKGGARLLLIDRDVVALDILLSNLGIGHEARAIDLTDRVSTEAAIQTGAERLNGIDVLCNIAGGFAMGPAVHETPTDQWQSMHEINVTTLINAVSAVVPRMLEANRGGKIVNVGALSAMTGKASMAAYISAKSVVLRLTESMAAELREKRINVNCVLPSIIDTPSNRAAMPGANFGHWVSPKDLADVVAFLASDAARAIHGAAIPVSALS
jgi:NAD(P)-dependent dehydrogenase (short-subunit alcohol dehydrogenase family)